MTPEEEWAVINTNKFDEECRKQINKIVLSLTQNKATADVAIETEVTGVYTRFQLLGNFIRIECGRTTQGVPQVDVTIPLPWLQEATP